MRASIQLLACALSTVFALPTWQPWGPAQYGSPQALYTMTNDVSGNQVVAMMVNGNGAVSAPVYYTTGGMGGNYVSPVDGTPLFPDALSAQDAVVTAGNYLFVVNAGSNTVSMFSISPSNPTSLKLLGCTSSKGQFPVALAASMSLMQVCVGHSGAMSGIACSSFSAAGMSGFDYLRYMNVGEKVTPPTGPTPGYGDILFSENNDMLLAMVKGNGTGFQGYAASFAVQGGKVGGTAKMATPPGSKALFGTGIIPGQPNLVLASDAGFGAVVLDIYNLGAQPLQTIMVPGQGASCWAEVSSTGRGFITDAAKNRLVEVSWQSGMILKQYYPPTPFGGMTDFRIAGNYLWALSASNGSYATSITTFDISGGPGSIKFSSVAAISGAGKNTQGLAWY